MRIVGGALSGRRFGKPVGDTRPTSERVREALGSALEARGLVRDSAVLDLFAGTGALGFELLSRGATRAVLVDHEARARRGIGQSAAALGLEDRTVVMSVDLLGPPARVVARLHEHGPFDLVIADPPWAEAGRVPSLLLALANAGVTAADARMVLEHASRAPPELPDGLATEASYRYGDTAVVVVRALPRPDEGTTPP